MNDTDKRTMDAMRCLLRERCFWTAGESWYDRQGYSMYLDRETAIRDVNYRGATLHSTLDEAVDAAIQDWLKDPINA